jgi:hypothetical protein
LWLVLSANLSAILLTLREPAQTPGTDIITGEVASNTLPDPPGSSAKSYGMQEVWGSNPHSSTPGQSGNFEQRAIRVFALAMARPSCLVDTDQHESAGQRHDWAALGERPHDLLRYLQEARRLESPKLQLMNLIRNANAMYSSGVQQLA